MTDKSEDTATTPAETGRHDGEEHTAEQSCPRCQGRGFTWDSDDYDGFYALCNRCNGSGHIPPERREEARS